ncbi:BEL1-LIKE HOMEODOMAIN PROTEIN 5 [Salix koriyanagi]|uniref:BEL1-LIKE HOMEODOMAIN PROTEIN 5 n=1 Tax=Salix koriyanagi TaxID=2511006 RepID=A0A9Q0TQ65_9ROSI|nr:BEL1-LIKE HOMEODOMAIN PROTEIN 5 [Salix koriyanagi]KAJ6715806.1 BEL1-LIKE HOMEODOMAIN PROTEIN 5 [Salix koriyanagi]
MATYFHGSSEIQAPAAPSDGIQTLYLMNPNYLSSYAESTQQQHQQQPPNMIFFNPSSSTAASNNVLKTGKLPHAPPQNHHFVGIPLAAPSSNITSLTPDSNSRRPPLHGVVPSHVHYSIWGSIDQNSFGSACESSAASVVGSPQVGFRRPVAVSPGRQALSLSLSSQQAPTPYNRAISNNHHEIHALHSHVSVGSSGDEIRISGNSPSSVSAVSNGVSGLQNMVLGSKYLRATQELLDEAVNVGKDLVKRGFIEGSSKERIEMTKEYSITGDGTGGGGETSAANRGAQLTTALRQDLRTKKGKLVNMLDEVEQRYGQYHHQMQVVVSLFEQAAGFGAAKSYTALALQTISKKFRSLKNTISSQIRATSKSLGEEDCVGAKVEGSRLRHVDHQLRQHNDWRPQRGLPERAVSVLRAWLFEHFLHPYPKDSDKHMLAKQTGLTRSQVSNWFINARVRLWKPMVEEMYVEEIKEQDSSEENASKKEKIDSGSHSTAPGESSSLQMDQLKGVLHSKQLKKPSNQNASPVKFSYPTISMTMGAPLQQQAGFTLIGPAEMEGISRRSSTEPSSEMQNPPSSILSMDMDAKQGETSREINVDFGGERLIKDGYPLIASSGGFGAYPMGDLGRFNLEQLTPRFSANGVSLTLGLPHCENLSLPGTEQNYLSNQNIQLGGKRRLEIGSGTEPGFSGIITSQNSHSSSGFESIDIQNRTRFPAQLLPDFVA